MIRLTFACGHSQAISEALTVTHPVCACGCREIAVVTTPRPPRFVGACTGPHAEFKHLEPATVNVATAGPLVIKEPSHDVTH